MGGWWLSVHPDVWGASSSVCISPPWVYWELESRYHPCSIPLTLISSCFWSLKGHLCSPCSRKHAFGHPLKPSSSLKLSQALITSSSQVPWEQMLQPEDNVQYWLSANICQNSWSLLKIILFPLLSFHSFLFAPNSSFSS